MDQLWPEYGYLRNIAKLSTNLHVMGILFFKQQTCYYDRNLVPVTDILFLSQEQNLLDSNQVPVTEMSILQMKFSLCDRFFFQQEFSFCESNFLLLTGFFFLC